MKPPPGPVLRHYYLYNGSKQECLYGGRAHWAKLESHADRFWDICSWPFLEVYSENLNGALRIIDRRKSL